MTERDQRLQDIRDRYEASTPGEWTPDTMGHEEICIDGVPLEIIFEELPNRDIPRDVYGHLLELHPDLEFIAHAHQDIPFLLAEIERLEAALTRERQTNAMDELVRISQEAGAYDE